MAKLLTDLFYTGIDLNGNVLGGAKLEFFITGTSTPLTVFTDNALTVAHTNPVIADSAGRFAPIYLQALDYKVVLSTSADVAIDTLDPVHGSFGDDALVTAAGGNTARLLSERFADEIHLKDKGVKADLVTAADGVTTAASAVLTSAGAAFTSGDIGKDIAVGGAATTGKVITGAVNGPADKVWQEDSTGGPSYVDLTVAFNNVAAGDVLPFPATEAVTDRFIIGHVQKFSKVTITIGTAGVGGTVTWKYWDGDSWANLSGVTDNTTGFTAAPGDHDLTFTVPSDWVPNRVNGSPQFYIAAEITGTYSTNPVLSQGILSGGRIRVTAAAHGFSPEEIIGIQNVTGTTEANAFWTVQVIDANNFDLRTSTFTNTYVSGGTAHGRLETTILSVESGTSLTMAANAGIAGTSVNYIYGTDDSAAVNAAIQDWYNLSEIVDTPVLVFPHNSRIRVTNLTDFSRGRLENGYTRKKLIRGNNCEIYGDAAGILVVDMLGVRSCRMDDLRITSNPAYPAAMGLLHCRQQEVEAGDRTFAADNEFNNVWVRGWFTLRAAQVMATEVSHWQRPIIENLTAEKECLYMPNADPDGLKATLGTRLTPEDVATSFAQFRMDTPTFRTSQTASGFKVPIVRMDSTQGMTFVNPFFKGEGTAAIKVEATFGATQALRLENLFAENTGITEGKYLDHLIEVVETSSITHNGWYLDFEPTTTRIGISAISIDPGGGAVQSRYRSFDIKGGAVINATATKAPLFSKVQGEIHILGHSSIRTSCTLDLGLFDKFVGDVHIEALADLTNNPTRLDTTGRFTTEEGFSGRINFWKSVTIATGVLTIAQGDAITVVGEGSVADNLDTITIANVRDGQRVRLVGFSGAQVITVTHNVGNILNHSGASNTLTTSKILEYEYKETASAWIEV